MHTRKRLYRVLLWGLIVASTGCRDTTVDAPTSDSAYFPLQTGDYWIYQVSEQDYSFTTAGTTKVFQVQEKVGSSFTQNGQVFFSVEESTRATAQSAWQLNAIRTVYKTLAGVVSQDNNVPALRLVFPINSTSSWNVNTYNAYPDTLLHYQDTNRSLTVGSQTYKQTVSVVGNNDSTLVGQHTYRWVYAQDVGLVYRENTALAFCQSSSDCIGKGIITSGRRQQWQLIDSNLLKQ